MQKETNNVVDLQEAWKVEWLRCKDWIDDAVQTLEAYTIQDVED